MTLHLLISGKVQGVFYRAEAKEQADALGIRGWIKNTPADKVEAVVSGVEENLTAFVEWCKQGPRRARVADVSVTPIDEQHFEGFTVIR